MQKTVVIDIGSNSVRKQVFAGGKILLRQTITTQLAKDIKDKKLAYESINRTFEGLDKLILAEKTADSQCFAFATACVRNCKNGAEFKGLFEKRYGITLDVLSGEREAEMGILGALSGEDGSVIDVGGGSTELVTAIGGKIAYAHSMQEGAVTLTDMFQKDMQKASEYIQKKLDTFKGFMCTSPVFAIGGTANTLAFIGSGISEYNPEKSEGYVLTCSELEERVREFYFLSGEEIAKKYNINQKRANVICAGALILKELLLLVNKSEIILTENDNLRGYYLKMVEGKGYEK